MNREIIKKLVIYVGLFIAFVMSLAIIILSFAQRNSDGNIELSNIAGSLAVITAILSTIIIDFKKYEKLSAYSDEKLLAYKAIQDIRDFLKKDN